MKIEIKQDVKSIGREGIYKRPKDIGEEIVIKLDQRTNERGDRNRK